MSGKGKFSQRGKITKDKWKGTGVGLIELSKERDRITILDV